MGTYIKNPRTDEQLKLSTADEIFFTHIQVTQFLQEGWEKQEDLRLVLDAPRSLFLIDRYLADGYLTERQREHLRAIKQTRPQVIVNTPQGTKPIGERIEHGPVIVQLKRQRPSVYVYTGLKCHQTGYQVYANIYGFRLNKHGLSVRTVLECDNCGKLFSLDEQTAEQVRKDNPYWANLIISNPEIE